VSRSELLDSPHGRCVLVALDDDAEVMRAIAALPELEQALAIQKLPHVRREFVAGRTALHLALGDFEPAIGVGRRGAPVMPDGFTGSISHKQGVAIAIVGPAGEGWVGIDLERAAAPKLDIARRILTEREQQRLPIDDERGRAVTLRFSIKEAIYKAVDPIVERYVGFTEVELDVGDVYCGVSSELPATIEATWREHAGHWIATARAIRR
jgi:enterobactin synthetase component D